MHLADIISGTGAEVFHTSPRGVTPGLAAPSDFGREVGGVSIDSRQASPGSMFVALPGEKVDGQSFVVSALENGASVALVREVPTEARLPANRTLLVAPSPLIALQRLAIFWRRKHTLDVIGVTGSLGKTSAKDTIAQALSPLGNDAVFKTAANLNTEIGVPLELLKLRTHHRAAVIEMGMYQPGDIALLARIARPQIGVVTNVHANHLERTGSIQRTAQGKAELVHALPRDGLAVLNGRDRFARAMQSATPARSVLYGPDAPLLDFSATDVVGRGRQGFSVTIRHGRRTMPLAVPAPGKHHALNLLPAVAVAHHLGVPWEDIGDALSELRIEGRASFEAGINGSTLLDDRYNASAASVIAAIELLQEEPGRHLALLGEMYELGDASEAEHRAVGATAAELDGLILIGERTRWIAEEAREHGHRNPITTVGDNKQAADAARQLLQSGDVLLIKGSRGLKLEEVVDALRLEAADAMCP